MIQIYKPDNTEFDRNGDMPLLPISMDVEAELNGTWKAEMQHQIDPDGRWKYIQEGAVVKAPSFNGEQLFRITRKEKRDSGMVAEMRPIFFDAKDDCFLADVRPTDKTGQEALDIMTAPNKKYSATSDITKISTAYYQTKNLIEAINGEDENSFVNRWGGEILYNNFNATINNRAGGDYGVKILYGKNIPEDGMEEEVDVSEVVTRIVPKAYNGHMIEGNTPWVDSPLIDRYPTVKYGVMTFEDVKMREDAQEDDEENGVIICDTQAQLKTALTQKCNEQFDAGLDKPTVTISADMVQLEKTDLYQDVKELEKVSLGDTVHCNHTKLDIVTDARVVSLKWDCINESVTAVTIGDFQYNYIDDMASVINRVESAIRDDGSVIGQQVQGIINGVKAQMKAQTSVAKKVTVRAVLMEDTDPDSPNFGAMCLGTMGFQIAGKRTADGRDWDWTTFGTGQGFIADLIVAGTMLADRVRGGTLVAGGGSGKGGVIQVLDEKGNEIGRWDLNGLNVKEGEISGTGITLGGGTGKNGYIRILNSAGEEIGRWGLNGLNVKEGEISGTEITLGGRNNEDGILELLDGSGNVIVRLSNSGIYAEGTYVCAPTGNWNSRVEIKNGSIKLSRKDGGNPIFIDYFGSRTGIVIRAGGNFGNANGSTTLMRIFDNAIYLDADIVGPSGSEGKSGRAEFSDGTYLDFSKGFLTGGHTAEGGDF